MFLIRLMCDQFSCGMQLGRCNKGQNYVFLFLDTTWKQTCIIIFISWHYVYDIGHDISNKHIYIWFVSTSVSIRVCKARVFTDYMFNQFITGCLISHCTLFKLFVDYYKHVLFFLSSKSFCMFWGLNLIRHVALGGGGVLAARNFHKFTYKELNNHGVGTFLGCM